MWIGIVHLTACRIYFLSMVKISVRNIFSNVIRKEIWLKNREMIKAHNERYEKGEETGRMVFTTYSDLVSMRHVK